MEADSRLVDKIRKIEGGGDIDKCFQCGTCTSQCRVVECSPTFNPRLIHNYVKLGLDEKLQEVFKCTLCARCKELCPRGVDTRSLRIAVRKHLVDNKTYPENLNLMKDAMEVERNVANFPNVDRAMWAEFLDEAPDDFYVRDSAEVIYFVGCMASFSPAVQSIPATFVTFLDKAEVDFTIMGEEEWCCGYPLIVAGMGDFVEPLKEHNLKRVKEIGAKKMVFSCPSCFHTWMHEYKEADVQMFHHTEFIKNLIDEGRIKLGELKAKVTYHDPCDLGRNSSVYDAPRQIIEAISAAEFVEMKHNREYALCCGGGGDLEVVDAKLPVEIGKKVIEQAEETGADILITSCQQCKRTLVNAVSKESKLKVMDILEVVMDIMDTPQAGVA
ncbi:MAG: (Fe-S)-binding protein [Actinomycetota bacterium]|nr:(Fe-S)-binding protein [Actinomycetota bacterium]